MRFLVYNYTYGPFHRINYKHHHLFILIYNNNLSSTSYGIITWGTRRHIIVQQRLLRSEHFSCFSWIFLYLLPKMCRPALITLQLWTCVWSSFAKHLAYIWVSDQYAFLQVLFVSFFEESSHGDTDRIIVVLHLNRHQELPHSHLVAEMFPNGAWLAWAGPICEGFLVFTTNYFHARSHSANRLERPPVYQTWYL